MRPLAQEILARLPAETEPPLPPSAVMTATDDEELETVLASIKPKIKVVGCGGGGSNTINRLSEDGLADAELFACNTDAQHLLTVNAHHKVLLGRRCTRGLGAGALPQVGEQAAREAEDELKKYLLGADMVFITLGLGGGTGTGGAPVVAEMAREVNQGNCLIMAVATVPFSSEGEVRRDNALSGLERLKQVVDTVITIPNDKLLELVPRLPLTSAFKVADSVLANAIRGITEIITKPGLVNLDFNDLKTIMRGGGVAIISIGQSESENRAEDAVNEALSSPLLNVEIGEAQGALVNVTGGPDMSISEAQKVAEIVRKSISPTARIIWGAAVDNTMASTIRCMIVLVGVSSPQLFNRETLLPFERRRTATGVDRVI